jgi:ABC-type polysaccharide/polyol phosphate transport system ATPase subunit
MTRSGEFAIEVEKVTKTYKLYDSHFDRVKETFHPKGKKYHRQHHALNDVTLKVHHGEFYGIIGRNGSGKSTLLQLVAGILQPNSGDIRVNGSVAALLELGAGFNPEFTGRQNVFLNATLLGISHKETEERFSAIEEFADIGRFIDQPVKTYSSGMYVRLAFAVAINVRPDILIVDEALAVGDMFFQQKCIRYMEENMKQCTKLLVTHDMHAVVNLCERVAVLHEGRLVFEGPPIESAEYYTKILHNDLYGKSVHREVTEPTGSKDIEDDTTSTCSQSWVPVSAEDIAGAKDVVITHVQVTDDKNEPATTAKPLDSLQVQMRVRVDKAIQNPIFGYMIRDRVGNGICGDNTLSLSERPAPLEPGIHTIQLNINWPDIYPADYLLTLGIGEGTHPLYHVIQCWAHNVILIKALNPGKDVHGIFTNMISKCEVETIDS